LAANIDTQGAPGTQSTCVVPKTNAPEMTDSTPQRKWLSAGFFVGILFLWIALSQTDLAAAAGVLRNLEYGWIAASIVCGMVFIVVKTLRWRIILQPVAKESFPALLQVVYIGTAANLIISHTGELLRMNILSRRQDVSPSAVLSSIGLERIFDFAALLIFTGLGLFITPVASPFLWSAGLISLSIVLLGVIVVLVLLNPDAEYSTRLTKLVSWLPARPREWLEHQIHRGRAGVSIIREPAAVIKLLLLSVFQWFWIVAAVWTCVQATGVQLSVFGAIAIFVLTIIGLTLPSSPAQLGTIQIAFVFGGNLVGLDSATGLAASIVYVFAINFVMLLTGGLFWCKDNWIRRAIPTATAKSPR